MKKQFNNSTNVEDSTSARLTQNPCYVQCGDNLELLKSQPNESVNMIYCDILYGTGRNFGDYQNQYEAKLKTTTYQDLLK